MTTKRVPAGLRRLVMRRAAGRCEYCGLSQEGQEATFHVDHVVPVAAGGQSVSENLALARVQCSLRKAARWTAIDPQSGRQAALYNPRWDDWREHFRWEGEYVVGLTPSGRATIAALDMNRLLVLAIRREEAAMGRHPAAPGTL